MKNKKIENILNKRILPLVTKPGRYVGNELNMVRKDPEAVSVRVGLAFPEVYELAMSYIGFDILYHVLNRQPHIWAERVYAPWTDMEERMRAEGLPLYSLESFTPLAELDIIGFTLQYELTYSNILNMLDLSGIPIWAKERTEKDPFIFGGGPCSCNSEPMAPFIDAFLIGDGEEAFVEMADVVASGRSQKKSRREILQELAQLRGVYIPVFYQAEYDADGWIKSVKASESLAPERVLSRVLPQLQSAYYPEKPIVPVIEVTHNRLSVEVMRGCTEGCRYCNAGMIYRPTRERPQEEIIEQMNRSLEATGYQEVSFLSLSISDYSGLNGLMRRSRQALQGKNINVSFPSMRLDSFTPEIAEFASSVRKSGFTFAPEAGSERLRRVINKNITADNLYRSVRIALENGWRVLKFYFMIGLPTETEEDVEAIADLIDEVLKISRAYGRIQFNVSVSPFSPKAHTPFQWERQNTKEEFQKKVAILRNRFGRNRQVKFSWRDPDVSLLECILGRADRRLAEIIYLAWKQGARFDGWSEHFKMDIWQEAAQKTGYPFTRFAQAIDPGLPLPWDHIDKGVSKRFLSKEREEAFREQTKIDCKNGSCYGCGIQRKDLFAPFASCYLPKTESSEPEPIPSATAITKPKQTEETVESRKVRIRYQKTAYARYLSHLDLIRIFERAARQAQVPVLYSQGFNPHPKLSFGPPLSLGYTSEAEYLDMELNATFDVTLLSDSINPYLPEGLQLLEVQEIHSKAQALAAAINTAEYEIELDLFDSHNSGFDEALETLLRSEAIEVERRVKGKYKNVNIRPYIESIVREHNRVSIKTRSIENRTVRVREILQQLFQDQHFDDRFARVHRSKQLIARDGKELTPIEILHS